MCNVWTVAGREQEGKKVCRKDAHISEINYYPLIAHSAMYNIEAIMGAQVPDNTQFPPIMIH